MNVKAVVPLVAAVVLGLVAALLVRNAMSHKASPVAGASNLVTVVVARQDATPGTALTREDVTTASVPADAAPGQVFSNPDQLVGRVCKTDLVKGQTILETLLAPSGTGGGLQALIPKGYRAVTLEVNECSGVGGMLTPGCQVDLISIVRDDKSNESVARTVLQNVKVQAIGRQITPVRADPSQPPPPPANNVTLLCTPKQVQTLQMASMTGRPWLSLRNTRDAEDVQLEGTTLAELRGNAGSGGATASAGSPATSVQPVGLTSERPVDVTHRTVTLIRGGVESQLKFAVPAPHEVFVDVPNDSATGPGH